MKWLVWLLLFPLLLPAKGVSMLYRGLSARNTINAIARGKAPQRVGRIIIGRAAGRLSRRLFP